MGVKGVRVLRYLLVAALLPLLLLANWRLYSPHIDLESEGVDESTVAQLRYLDEALHEGAGERMQGIFPEGFAFTHVLTGLSWAEVARRERNSPLLRQAALAKARWGLAQLESPKGRAPFDSTLNSNPNSPSGPSYGAFYAGWTLLLRGRIVEAEGSERRGGDSEWGKFSEGCERLATAFGQSPTPFLQSYPGSAWPADALVGITALRLHDHLYTPRYSGVIARWIADATNRCDPVTGLFPHAVDAETGYPVTGARGSSQSLMLRFLAEVDPQLARAYYMRFRRLFLIQRFGLPGIREFPEGAGGTGDVDSGPVLFGIGASATVVGIGTATTFGDGELADALAETVEGTAFPVAISGRKCYLLGKLPVMDPFLLWSKLARPLVGLPEGGYQSVVGWWWRLPIHCLSALLIGLLLGPEVARGFSPGIQGGRTSHK